MDFSRLHLTSGVVAVMSTVLQFYTKLGMQLCVK